MNLTSHLAELRRKHAHLETVIEKERRSPASDDLNIVKWKKEKLRLKEEIQRLSSSEAVH